VADLPSIIISIVCFIPAIVVHEVAHGFMAHKLGDPTAKAAGRLSLNPIAHVDPFGTVILPLILAFSGAPVFGYAKPVPYNPRYFKNIKVGEVLTGLAGPASNLIMALLGALVAFIVLNFTPLSGDAWGWTRAALYYFVLINLCLMFFNLLPIPPLDGSSVIVPFLPQSALPTWYKIQHYAMPALILLVIVVPMLLPGSFNPIGIYIQATAGNLARLLFGF